MKAHLLSSTAAASAVGTYRKNIHDQHTGIERDCPLGPDSGWVEEAARAHAGLVAEGATDLDTLKARSAPREKRQEDLMAILAAAPIASSVHLLPRLADAYRQMVESLQLAIGGGGGENLRQALRGLIEPVGLHSARL